MESYLERIDRTFRNNRYNNKESDDMPLKKTETNDYYKECEAADRILLRRSEERDNTTMSAHGFDQRLVKLSGRLIRTALSARETLWF